jgi:hypothetical protein
MNSPAPTTQLDHLLAQFPESIRLRFWEAREWLYAQCPGFIEEVDLPARMAAYNLGPGYKGMVASLIPSQGGLKLGLVGSAGFPDPHGLLEGKGKVHRHVALPPAGPASVEGVQALFDLAVAACKERLKK